MKKKITLSIDEDVYDGLGVLPRGISVSEAVSWFLRFTVEESKLGRSMTQEEFNALIERTPGGRDFVKRLDKSKWAHNYLRIGNMLGFDKLMDRIEKKTAKKKRIK